MPHNTQCQVHRGILGTWHWVHQQSYPHRSGRASLLQVGRGGKPTKTLSPRLATQTSPRRASLRPVRSSPRLIRLLAASLVAVQRDGDPGVVAGLGQEGAQQNLQRVAGQGSGHTFPSTCGTMWRGAPGNLRALALQRPPQAMVVRAMNPRKCVPRGIGPATASSTLSISSYLDPGNTRS